MTPVQVVAEPERPALGRILGRRHRTIWNLLAVDWPQGLECVERARSHLGDGLIERTSGRPVVALAAETALSTYARHIGGNDRQRIETCVEVFLHELAGAVAGLRVAAPGEVWEPWHAQTLPEFQSRHGPEQLQVTRADSADIDALAAALRTRFLPSSLARALRWWSDQDGNREQRGDL